MSSESEAAPEAHTVLVYQHDAKCYTLSTTVVAVLPYASLPSASQALFKQGQQAKVEADADAGASAPYYAVVTAATIFHPQGGGQPSDIGTIRLDSVEGRAQHAFDVLSARMDAVQSGRVLHFGRFSSSSNKEAASVLPVGSTVHQAIDVDKRILYSRLHTAGHVLGAAVRHLVENEVAGFDELKASHFPDAASCEFRGKIDAHWKEPIQARVADYIAQAMPVEIDWWDAADFRRNGLDRLIPQPSAPSSGGGPDANRNNSGSSLQTEKWRIVRIVGAEVYPCGGTHVDTTDQCGETRVTKISRSKGISRVSYALEDSGKA
ncbi:hypothetical protein SCUCBS95973_007118 [Sporothrix curviconia]|uniref:Threonyl/alanyl tRNA synthetase SAD domain-containing protein n=1 Tax=Sporothrix curviconia TaxID=1260050 RepID=A0ABP0CAS4_9PEZI